MYNSAVSGKYSVAPSLSEFSGVFENENILAFRHDICDGVNPLFWKADAIYSGMAWKNGYEKFVKNTIAQNSSFDEYVTGLVKTIRTLGVPAFIVCGKSFIKKMKPDKSEDIYFKTHNYNGAQVAIFNYFDEVKVKDEFELRNFMGRNFNTVLDPCCGYGAIIDSCKNSIVSDINNDCLNYIVKKYGLRRVE